MSTDADTPPTEPADEPSRLRRFTAAAEKLLRRPVAILFPALLVFWTALYWEYDPPNNRPAPGNGEYKPILGRGDGHYIYLNTLSLCLDGNLDLRDEYKTLGDPFHLGAQRTKTGRPYIYPIGTSLLQAPFFVAAHASSKVANLFGAKIPSHGYTPWHHRITFFGTLLAGLAALYLGYRFARRHTSETAALYGALIVGLGTPLLFYSVYWVSYPHAWSALTVALLVERWDATRGRHDVRRYALLGVLVGLCALSRAQEVTFALLPGLEALAELVRRCRKRDWRGAAMIPLYGLVATACAVIVFFPQLYVHKTFYGGWFNIPQGKGYMRWSAPFLYEVLYSTKNGLFVWTPLAYLCSIGLFLAPKKARVLAVGLILSYFAQLWVNGSTWDWWGNWGFSARRLIDMTGVFVVGAAFLIERLRALHVRVPRLAPHVAVVLALLPLALLNVELSCAVSHEKLRPAQTTSSVTLYSGSFSRFYGWIHGSGGNPFAWPANLLWAARYDSKPSRFDDIVGVDILQPDYKSRNKLGARRNQVVKILANDVKAFGHGKWIAPPKDGSRTLFLAGPGARFFFQLFWADDVRWIVRVAPPDPGVVGHATLDINGRYQKEVLVVHTTDVELDPGDADRNGTNILSFKCDDPAPSGGCLAVESVNLVFERRARE